MYLLRLALRFLAIEAFEVFHRDQGENKRMLQGARLGNNRWGGKGMSFDIILPYVTRILRFL